jgi:arsenite-transporting ATPase
LFALNIDPEAAAHAYRERMVAPYRGILPAAAIQSMEEQFSGACTVEIAAFDEFSKLLGRPDATADFDHVIFDTAPTGHTLRLLTLPSAWSEFIADPPAARPASARWPGSRSRRPCTRRRGAPVRSRAETTVILVSRPEAAAPAGSRTHAGRTGGAGHLQSDAGRSTACSRAQSEDAIATCHVASWREPWPDAGRARWPVRAAAIPFLPTGTVGLDALRLMAHPETAAPCPVGRHAFHLSLPPGLAGLVDEMACHRPRRRDDHGQRRCRQDLGGCGDCRGSRRRGGKVVLSTTDPAAHVAATLDGAVPGLTVTPHRPGQEVADYTAEVLAKAGKSLDAGAAGDAGGRPALALHRGDRGVPRLRPHGG